MKKNIWEIIFNGVVNLVYTEEPVTEMEARKILREQINCG